MMFGYEIRFIAPKRILHALAQRAFCNNKVTIKGACINRTAIRLTRVWDAGSDSLRTCILRTTSRELTSVRPTPCLMLSRRHGLGGPPIMCIHLSLEDTSSININTSHVPCACTFQANECVLMEPFALYCFCMSDSIDTSPSLVEPFADVLCIICLFSLSSECSCGSRAQAHV